MDPSFPVNGRRPRNGNAYMPVGARNPPVNEKTAPHAGADDTEYVSYEHGLDLVTPYTFIPAVTSFPAPCLRSRSVYAAPRPPHFFADGPLAGSKLRCARV